MGDSRQPKPAVPQFEVPDLELEPFVRPARPAATPINSGTRGASARAYTAPNPFDDDPFSTEGPNLDLAAEGEQDSGGVGFAGAGFDALGELELEGNAQSGLSIDSEAMPHSRAQAKPAMASEPLVHWPSGRAPAREQLKIDEIELKLLAKYGEPPKNIYLTPAYAYRVFTRQRELKDALVPLEAERARADAERESTLAELGRAVRPVAERNEQFGRLFAPLLELEQVASVRGPALSSVAAEHDTQARRLDEELAAIGQQLAGERARERDAQRLYDEREATAKRADAKLKRVHIEIRAVTEVAQEKLAPQGGTIPEHEATQLADLKQRADGVLPEVNQAKAGLQQARVALEQASARVAAVVQSERLASRKKLALVQHYQQELNVRARGLSESEARQRAALADLGRAVLAGQGSVAVPEVWLERVRSASQQADALLLRAEMQRRALDVYDRARVAQGIRLAGTGAGLCLLLIVLKLVL